MTEDLNPESLGIEGEGESLNQKKDQVKEDSKDSKETQEEDTGSVEFLSKELSFLSGIQKSAILLTSLNKEGVTCILKELQPRHVQQISLSMANLFNLQKSTSIKVFKLFLQKIKDFSSVTAPTIDFIRESLIEALGAEKAESIIEQITQGRGAKGLDALRWMSDSDVFSLIHQEHPQVQAIVLSYLDPNHSASIFEMFSEKLQLDIILRISCLDQVNTKAMDELNKLMSDRSSDIDTAESTKFEGAKIAASIMNNVSSALENKVLSWVKDTDEDLCNKISDLMFVFESFLEVSDLTIQRLLRDVNNDLLVKSLKGASTRLQEKIMSNVSSKLSETIQYDLNLLGPVRISDVEKAQRQIIAIAKKLESQQIISLAPENSSDYVN